jgi:PKD domain
MPLFSITLPNASAQISSLSSAPSPSPSLSPSPSPSASSIGVKIDSHTSGQQVPINSILRISGSSTDTLSTDCKASVIVNNIKPYQPVAPAEINDFSTWNFLLNSSYTSIKEGPDNKITAKLECPPNLTKWYSVNLTGISSSTQDSLNRSLPSPSPSSSPRASQLISNFSSNADDTASPTNPLFNTSIINITSPVPGEQVPSGSEVTIWGTSMDNYYSNCKVYAKRNDLPFQNATAAGLTGSGDYSVWKFTYTSMYGLITPGNSNNLTAKISCIENSNNLSPASSIIRTNINTEDADGAANIALVGVNQPPIVEIHVDNQEVKEGEEIVLDGKDSSDPNGDSLTYLWKQTGGFLDGSDILNPTEPVAHFKVPDDLIKDTTFDFELVVTDNYGSIGTKTISITAASNSAPVADAGRNIQAIRGEQVALDGSDSHDPDPTGQIISYLWRSSSDNGDGDNGDRSGTSLQNRNQPVATFSVPLVQGDTTFEFSLIVTDDEGAEDEDSVEVEVKGNSKPVADAGSDKKAEIGEQVTLDGGGSNDPDPTGEIVSYDWEQTGGSPSVGLNDASSATPSFTVPTIDEDTAFEFTLTVTDNEGATEEDKVQVDVEAPSPPPPPPSADDDLSEESEEDDQSSPLDEIEAEEDEETEEEDEEEEEEEDEEGDGTDLFNSALRQFPEMRDLFP